MSNNIAISPYTMPAALAAADTGLGSLTNGPLTWHGDPSDAEQMAWLESFRRRATFAARMREIDSNATGEAKIHAQWLYARGWPAQITQGSPGDLFLAATLNVVAKWRSVGRSYKDGAIDRVVLSEGAYAGVDSGSAHPVIEVNTQHPDFSFHFQQVDRAPGNRADLAELARDMVLRGTPESVRLDFPMVDLIVREDAGYMLGLRSGKNVVTQAAEQLRLELNEVGGRASAAAEVAVTRGMRPPEPRTVKLEGPFLVAVADHKFPQDDQVVFAAYCDESVWRRPGEGRI